MKLNVEITPALLRDNSSLKQVLHMVVSASLLLPMFTVVFLPTRIYMYLGVTEHEMRLEGRR